MRNSQTVWRDGGGVYYVMVSKAQWQPFWLVTQLYAQNYWLGGKISYTRWHMPHRLKIHWKGKFRKPRFGNFVIQIYSEEKNSTNSSQTTVRTQGRSNEKETGPAEVRRMWKKDGGKSCEARQAVHSTALLQLGVWGRCKPPSGVRGRAPEAFENFTLSHHKVDWFWLTLAWKVPRL